MGFLEVMKEREQIAQITHEDELREHLGQASRTAYIGFDPTAPSLHVGHLLQIMTLRRWQQNGHRVIAVIGGATALIGDPSGKTEMRQMLTEAQIQTNMAGLKQQLGKFIDFSAPAKAVMLNNADWLKRLNYLELLREVGAHFSVNRMLTAEAFRQRYERGLSFLEFNYMILQSYDFLHLHRTEGCTLQMGGDDQWSNILSGMELVRRLAAAKAFCLTTPLLTTSEGKKMGKTEKGAVWLDPQQTSPYEYFQFWRNIEDALVRTALASFTELPMPEVERLASLSGAAINEAKLILAYECTKLLHGTEAADQAQETTRQLFSQGGGSSGGEPQLYIEAAAFGDGMNVIDFLVAAGVVPSKSEARRLIQQGGLVINEEKVQDAQYTVTKEHLLGHTGGCLVRKGKKHYFRIGFSG